MEFFLASFISPIFSGNKSSCIEDGREEIPRIRSNSNSISSGVLG